MFTLTAWQPAPSLDSSKDQRSRTLYLPNAGEYRSIYWNKVPADGASVLAGIMPENRFAQAGIALALAGAIWFGSRALSSKGMLGLAGPKRRRKRRKPAKKRRK